MIYFDNSATTRISAASLDRYCEVSRSHFGNPSSRHTYGHDAKKILEDSRKTVASVLGDGTVIFGASGSESDNLALFGRAYAKERFAGGKIITSAGEHSAIMQSLAALEKKGYKVAVIPTKGGFLDKDALEREMTKDVFLVSIMTVNNETGAAYDLKYVSRLMKMRSPEAVLHTDATQAFCKMPLSALETGASLITLSSHKVEGPKGVSALYVSREVLKNKGLSTLIYGGGQEENLRSGTENLPGIAAFATAVKEGQKNLPAYIAAVTAVKERILTRLAEKEAFAGVKPVLPPVAVPWILSLTMPKIKSETMLNFLSDKGICVSSGSACSSHDRHLSSALLAYGLTESEADTTVRLSFGRENTVEEADIFCDALAEGLSRLAKIH